MTSTYGDSDAQMGGGHGHQQQQQQHMSDADMHGLEHKIQQGIQQLHQSGDMIHTSGPPQAQYPQMAQMAPTMNAHQHFQQPTRPAHSPQQMANAVMSLGEHHDPYDPSDPSRKRSKVSRACDECRRKKIRCDATSENGPEACSSCKRTAARCQFSRQPMKRGPSKGYIKELADRLNSLESQIQHPQNTPQNYDFGSMNDQNFADTQSPPQFNRKRTHSMAQGFNEPNSRPSWSGQDRGNDHPLEQRMLSLLTHQESSLNGNRRTSFGEMTLAGSLITGSNEGTLKAYYNIVHPTLPILPHDSSSLNRLTHCPPKLREAFFLSLEGCIRSIASKALPQIEPSLNQLLHQCCASVDEAKYILSDADSTRQFYNNLVYCQSLMLLAIASDRPGPGTVGSTAQLLGQIAGFITEMGLNDSRALNMLRDQDQEVFQTARRVFWTAFILDRFHASSRSKDILLPLHSGSLSRDDYSALGEVGYHLARAAKIVGQVAFVNRADNVPNPESSSSLSFTEATSTSPQSIYLDGQIAGFHESIDIINLTSSSPPHLAYQYLRLFVARLSPQTATSAQTLSLTKELLTSLANGAITPLHHIFASLVATSLTELSDRGETQVEAQASVKEMSDALSNGQIIYRSPDSLGWDTAIRELLLQKKASPPPFNLPDQAKPATQPNMAGLQHLAAAAVEREGVDARPISSGGNGTPSQPSKEDDDLSAAMAAANEAAKAQEFAAAAQQQMSASPNGNGGSNFDTSGLKQDGFMASS